MKRILTAVLILVSLISIPLVTAQAASDCAARHTVLAGENLFRIGLRYGLQWPAIAAANNISDPRRLRAGQVLCIPSGGSGTVTTPTPTRTGVPPTSAPTVVPGATATPLPTLAPSARVPRITIVSVVRDQTVSISAVDFPAGQSFDVLMGAIGTRGVNGVRATTQNSGTGVFTATYNIPDSLKGSAQIAIRLQSTSGYFSYNWFHNR